ncbi:MbcA/ParS/Xre antitoxin family protein [Pseudomonas sp. BN102]|uniref:MbcA/ParS/Xre antitoxin family protein n=1 Tax=Pseudomonas sp. BN102 TaxID=2567886 RepID=UPI002457A49C|nr:MbcA/ParS/Xre antitoxin family protein [Pseudomonas sp. BN102]MDH4609713.1 DUF2384 domain-containing protein [Pseudomonas sp. BN102]
MSAIRNHEERKGMAKPAAFWTLVHARAKLTENQRLAEIKAGLGTEWVVSMKEAFHVSTQLLLTFANASASTLERRKKGNLPLDQVASERLDRLASVALLAEEVFEDKQAAADWMSEPNQSLGGRQPLSLCDTEIGANQVRRVLHAIEWGGAA